MEFVAGGSLADHLDGTPLPPRDAAALLVKCAEGVQAAHAKGVIHRDLKPANILLADKGESDDSVSWSAAVSKIADFGLAKHGGSDLTATGAILGTPSYMAPEQAEGKGKRIGPATDVYALGAILYELLTGRPPFKAATPLETLQQVLSEEPVPPRKLQPQLPIDLETICLKCLQKDTGKRYASAAALGADLRCFLDGEPINARRAGRWEKVRRWQRRNRTLVNVSSVWLLVCVGLILVFAFIKGERPNTNPAKERPGTAPQAGTSTKASPPNELATYECPPFEPGVVGYQRFTPVVFISQKVGSEKLTTDQEGYLSNEAAKRIKQAAVRIQTERGESSGTGSGFFCFEKGLVVTTAHKVGLMNPFASSPAKLEIIVNSGERNEMKLAGVVEAVDHMSNLALVRVPVSEKLPEPLALVSAETVDESQRVYAIGFPFGETLGKDLTITPTRITSILASEGRLHTLQLSGGINPGNTGGPIVDKLGRVVGLAVRFYYDASKRQPSTSIALPSDSIYALAKGTVSSLETLPPAKQGNDLFLPVRVNLTDPLRQIRRVSVLCWTSPRGVFLPGQDRGEVIHAPCRLEIQNNVAHAMLALPPRPANHVYWLQVVVENDGGKRYSTAHPLETRLHLDPEAWKAPPYEKTTDSWTVDRSAKFLGKLFMGQASMPMAVHWHETQRPGADGEMGLVQRDVGFSLSGRPVSRGQVHSLLQFGDQDWLQRSLTNLEPSLPDRPLEQMSTWEELHDLPLNCLLFSTQVPLLRVRCTYLGTTSFKGRPQVLVGLEGHCARTAENPAHIVLKGIAAVDVKTRTTTYLYLFADLSVRSGISGLPQDQVNLPGERSATGHYEFCLKRTPVSTAP